MAPEIQNVLTTVDLDCLLDLDYIARNSANVVYNPAIFNGLTMRLRHPKSTANIFTSGKIVCLGTRDEDSARRATRKFARIIQKLGFPVKFKNFRITNIVASTSLDFRPDYRNNHPHVDFNAEIFPGLVYRDGVTIIVFKSGKVILTNAKTREAIFAAYDTFYHRISINRGGNSE